MIYLDANSTSRLRPEVCEAMKALHSERLGNPSSVHSLGRKSRALLRAARQKIKDQLCSSVNAKIIFTSGATEACNLMTRGFIGDVSRVSHVVSSSIEHPAVLENLQYLKLLGHEVTLVNPKENGIVAVEDILSEVRNETALVLLMAANNESGALQPVVALGKELRKQNYTGAFACDATQAIGKSAFSIEVAFMSGVDAVAISSHKLGGPCGAGALIINSEINTDAPVCRQITPIIRGGVQEGGFRAGTEDVVNAVGFALAVELSIKDCASKNREMLNLRELLFEHLDKNISNVTRLSPKEECLSNTLLLGFSESRGDDLVVALDVHGICASTGSACASGKQGISHVVMAMGLSAKHAREVIRLSLDWDASEIQIMKSAEIIAKTVKQVRTALSLSNESRSNEKGSNEGSVVWN